MYFSTTASPSMIVSWEVGGDDIGWYGLTWRVGTERKIPGTKSLSTVADGWVLGKMGLLLSGGDVMDFKDGMDVDFESSLYSETVVGLTVWVVTTIWRGVVVVVVVAANDGDIVIVLWSTVLTWQIRKIVKILVSFKNCLMVNVEKKKKRKKNSDTIK